MKLCRCGLRYESLGNEPEREWTRRDSNKKELAGGVSLERLLGSGIGKGDAHALVNCAVSAFDNPANRS